MESNLREATEGKRGVDSAVEEAMRNKLANYNATKGSILISRMLAG